MLDQAMLTQLQAYFANLKHPIELIATLGDDTLSADINQLIQQIASLSDLVTARTDGNYQHVPSFSVAKVGEAARIHFAGMPTGHEFTSLVLALLHTGGHPAKVSDAVMAQIKAIDTPHQFETFVSLTCHNCPDVVQALNIIAANNPLVSSTMIDGSAFQAEAELRQVMAVPAVFDQGVSFTNGRISIEEIISKLTPVDNTQQASTLSSKAPFDMLIVGAGPAGASAAIYAARKGLRTGMVAERFGGQVLDTVGIENFITTPFTEGPKLARQLEGHVNEYDVDIMTGHIATALSKNTDDTTTITLANGAELTAKSVVISTGARWREMNVPGESQYKGKGVAYCPHCDGPFFKGKRVAVIGGGNSGVEAAIDLAGIVSHVTLVEFDTQLRADAVLQTRLRSLANVDIVTNTLSTEVEGDGSKVTALHYKDRATEQTTRLALDGIFVQIGLLPNTDWLKGTVELSNRGEIVVNASGATNVAGVFAAGDVTTVPFKQIIISMGEGAKAALGAFDYLIRQ